MSMTPEGGVEVLTIDVTEIAGTVEIPCDWSEMSFHVGDPGAEWIVYLMPCACGRTGARLICTHCKDVSMATDDAVQCSHCGEVYAPFRSVIHLIEPLDKRP